MVVTDKSFSIIGVLLCAFWVFVTVSHAATYYVDGAAGNDSNPGTLGSPWKTVHKANTTLQAGDTVYFRAGIYNISGNGIAPNNSGSSYLNRIIFSTYNRETVTFVGVASGCQGIYLCGKNYIKVNGIIFNNFYHPMLITGASKYNEISYCTFAGSYDPANSDWVGSRIRSASMYNHVHHCSFRNYGYADGTNHNVVFGVGIEASTSDGTKYNLVEYNQFAHGGHHVVEVNGTQNVFRYNSVRNDPWMLYNGTYYADRIMFFAGLMPDVGRNLIHGNRIGYGGETSESNQCGGSGGTLSSAYNILRRNIYFKCLLYGLNIKTYMSAGTPPVPTTLAANNYIYHNTFWNNGITTTCQSKPPWSNYLTHAIAINENATYTRDNVIKNNLFWANVNLGNTTRPVVVSGSANLPVYNTVTNNLNETSDPRFVNISDTPDPTLIATQFDFNLQPGSPAINAAGFLTTITSASGSGTSFTVADANYFFDGWGMSAISTASISGDTIQLQGQTATATITNVNYNTNTITVNKSLTWTKGQGIALAYEGSAPDMGAHEFTNSSAPAIPSNLRIVN